MASKQQAIAELAYLLWESRGRPHHTAERDWAEAEALLAQSEARSEVLTEAPRKPGSRRKSDAKPKVTARRDIKRPSQKGAPSPE